MLEVINIIEIWNSFFFYQKYILFVSIEFWECPENWKKQFHLDLDMQFSLIWFFLIPCIIYDLINIQHIFY